MISVEESAESRRLHRVECVSIRAIRRHLGKARDMVARSLGTKDPVCTGGHRSVRSSMRTFMDLWDRDHQLAEQAASGKSRRMGHQ